MRILLPKLIKGAVLPTTMCVLLPSSAGPKILTVPSEPSSVQQPGLPLYGGLPPSSATVIQAVAEREIQSNQSSNAFIQIANRPKRLEISDEKHFNSLAIKEAKGTITPEELAELERLDSRRLVDEPGLSPRAIEARERLLGKIEDLIDELNSFGNRNSKTI